MLCIQSIIHTQGAQGARGRGRAWPRPPWGCGSPGRRRSWHSRGGGGRSYWPCVCRTWSRPSPRRPTRRTQRAVGSPSSLAPTATRPWCSHVTYFFSNDSTWSHFQVNNKFLFLTQVNFFSTDLKDDHDGWRLHIFYWIWFESFAPLPIC